jgi:hypothetical protein
MLKDPIFLKTLYCFLDNVKKIGTVGKATDDNMTYAQCMLGN